MTLLHYKARNTRLRIMVMSTVIAQGGVKVEHTKICMSMHQMET